MFRNISSMHDHASAKTVVSMALIGTVVVSFQPSLHIGHEPFPGIIWLCSSSEGVVGTGTYSSSCGGGGTSEEDKHGSHAEEAAGNSKEQDEANC